MPAAHLMSGQQEAVTGVGGTVTAPHCSTVSRQGRALRDSSRCLLKFIEGEIAHCGADGVLLYADQFSGRFASRQPSYRVSVQSW